MPPQLECVIQEARVRRVPRNQFILYQGDVPTDVYILSKGVVKIYDIDDQGNEKILHLLKPAAIAPLAFFSGPNHATQWFYTTLVDCELYVLPFDQLGACMRENNELTMYLMNWFSLEVHELLLRLSSLQKSSVRDKVMAALKFLYTQHAHPLHGSWRRVNFPVSHQMLGAMTGVTRESVTMCLGTLEEEGVVRTEQFVTLDIHGSIIDA